MKAEFTLGLSEIGKVVLFLEEHIRQNTILFLSGDLAAGKTTLASAIAKSKGFVSGATSPTFSLQQCYGERLFHYDLYRITNEEFFALGLHEEFDKEGWHLVEWADAPLKEFLANAGYNTASIDITSTGKSRHYTIEV